MHSRPIHVRITTTVLLLLHSFLLRNNEILFGSALPLPPRCLIPRLPPPRFESKERDNRRNNYRPSLSSKCVRIINVGMGSGARRRRRLRRPRCSIGGPWNWRDEKRRRRRCLIINIACWLDGGGEEAFGLLGLRVSERGRKNPPN